MRPRIWIGIVCILVFSGAATIYVQDSRTAEQALEVEEFLINHCTVHQRYPDVEVLDNRFPELFAHREWYYWLGEAGTTATFQYPMTLPLPFAPGRSKFSEFIPVIYSYAVVHPCRDVIRKGDT